MNGTSVAVGYAARFGNLFLLTLLVSVIFGAAACTTMPEKNSTTFVDVEAPKESYDDTLDTWTKSDKSYNGIVATIHLTATVLSSDMVRQQVYKDAKQYKWSSEQYREARQKALYESQSATTVFLMLFTEKDETNNLDKSNSIWNIYLQAGEARVKPESIKRVHESQVALTDKYPYYNVWSRPYLIKFPISTSAATSGPLTLVLTGPLGSAELKFLK